MKDDLKERPLQSGENPETPIHIGYDFKVLATGEAGECIEVDNLIHPPRLLLKFQNGRSQWHCRARVAQR